jgi:hypothetical protein
MAKMVRNVKSGDVPGLRVTTSKNSKKKQKVKPGWKFQRQQLHDVVEFLNMDFDALPSSPEDLSISNPICWLFDGLHSTQPWSERPLYKSKGLFGEYYLPDHPYYSAWINEMRSFRSRLLMMLVPIVYDKPQRFFLEHGKIEITDNPDLAGEHWERKVTDCFLLLFREIEQANLKAQWTRVPAERELWSYETNLRTGESLPETEQKVVNEHALRLFAGGHKVISLTSGRKFIVDRCYDSVTPEQKIYGAIINSLENTGEFSLLHFCPECHRLYIAERSNQKFCGPACYKNSERRRSRSAMQTARALEAKAVREAVVASLKRIQAQIQQHKVRVFNDIDFSSSNDFSRLRNILGEKFDMLEPFLKRLIAGKSPESVAGTLPTGIAKRIAAL